MNMRKKIFEYVLITLGIILTALGVYLFKFPNHFAFGGATGIATVVEAVTGINASDVSGPSIGKRRSMKESMTVNSALA